MLERLVLFALALMWARFMHTPMHEPFLLVLMLVALVFTVTHLVTGWEELRTASEIQ